MPITLRERKGSALTHAEMDSNLLYLSFKADLLQSLGSMIIYDNGGEYLYISELASMFQSAYLEGQFYSSQFQTSTLYSGVTVVPFESLTDAQFMALNCSNENYQFKAYRFFVGSLFELPTSFNAGEFTLSVEVQHALKGFLVFLPTNMTNSDFTLNFQ